jgi:hypothetical protein
MFKKIIDTYRDGGWSALSDKAYYVYCYVIEAYVRPRVAMEETVIELSGVEVPVYRSSADRYLPFYAPAVPIRSDAAYEADEIDAIREYVEPGDHVVVVGGGLGVTTTAAARAAGESGRVTVFEPSSTALKICQRTVEHNGIAGRVHIEQASIGAPQNSCFTYSPQEDMRRVSYGEMPSADVYEMDCEGEELPIIRNMTIRPRVMLVETHGNHDEVVAALESHGYRIDSLIDEREARGADRTHIRAVYNL